jgi:diaminohydroxyphosphoribosylaminopyrimidine deaminase/5-amino-6-(5-phosphoribosylamino)uracil reductase
MKMKMDILTNDEKYMQRCLQLAALGLGGVAPNPLVGSVIVYNDKIIGEGFHRKYGEPHAEVNAIESVKDQSLLEKSTLYVNLEPCAHFGKTPPCADLIVSKRIPRVVIGCVDTFSKVAGKGIEKMQSAGIEVVVGVLEKKSRHLNRRFFTFHEKKRPYVILKWAQTSDGFIDTLRDDCNNRPAWITNNDCRILVHKWRTEESAILVGKRTALNDNPRLNVRNWSGKAPVRMVIDKDLSLPESLHLFDGSQRTLIFNSIHNEESIGLQNVGLNFEKLPEEILNWSYNSDIQSIIIEGGTHTLQQFIDMDLWDEVRLFTGKMRFGRGVKAPYFSCISDSCTSIGDAKLEIFLR